MEIIWLPNNAPIPLPTHIFEAHGATKAYVNKPYDDPIVYGIVLVGDVWYTTGLFLDKPKWDPNVLLPLTEDTLNHYIPEIRTLWNFMQVHDTNIPKFDFYGNPGI